MTSQNQTESPDPELLHAINTLQKLPEMLRAERARRKLTKLRTAREIGIAKATIFAVEEGAGYHVYTAIAVMHWLAISRCTPSDAVSALPEHPLSAIQEVRAHLL